MEQLIQDWGYIILAFYSFGGGMAALIVAAILSASGDLNIIITLIVAAIANFVGDQFLFTLARNNKNQAKQMMQKYRRKIALSHLLMRKYGAWVIFIQKYIYGIKTLIPLAMGLTKYDYKRFFIYNIFASIIWTLFVGISAYLLGNLIYDYLKEFKEIGIAIIFVIVFIVWYYFKKI
jgi:membrane protein DedA with SNARE-associated domain